MSDVFISYARSTASQAQRIADALRALGYDVWRDDDLPAHRPYADVIDERLRSARAAGALTLVLALVAVAVWRLVPQGPARLPGQNGHVELATFDVQGTDPALRKIADDTSQSIVRILSGAGVQIAGRSAQQSG